MSLPAEWKPRWLPDLARLGSAHDGGYVVPERAVAAADVLVSLGISDDWTFERDFCARNPHVRVVAYDHTVTGAFWAKRIARHAYGAVFRFELGSIPRMLDAIRFRRFFGGNGREHRRRKIGYAGAGSETADQALESVPGRRLFLKIDIEGWEYRILDQIPRHAERLVGLAVEFHDVDLMRERISAFLAAMGERFVICHLHGNNCAGVDGRGDPLAIEMTLIRRDLLREGEPGESASYPIERLDAPNDPAMADVTLRFG